MAEWQTAGSWILDNPGLLWSLVGIAYAVGMAISGLTLSDIKGPEDLSRKGL